MNQLNLFPKTAISEKEAKEKNEDKNRIDIYKRVYKQISWQQLLWKLVVALRVPFVSGKHYIITYIKNYFQTRPFPWFRVALVFLFIYAYVQKDMRFNINMGTPPAILSEEDQTSSSTLMMGGFAQATNFSNEKEHLVNLVETDVNTYIKRFSKVAKIEMTKFGIPASVKMGQAILASHAGKNKLASQYNNHFATTCSGGARCERFTTGSRQAMVKTYQNAWESWRDHSNLLSDSNYAHLKECGGNYKKWANGLEKTGYGNANNYAKQLIKVIETYQLYKLDLTNENL